VVAMNNFVKYVELILRLVWTGATFVLKELNKVFES